MVFSEAMAVVKAHYAANAAEIYGVDGIIPPPPPTQLMAFEFGG